MSRIEFALEPYQNEFLGPLLGPMDANIRALELKLGVSIAHRGGVFAIDGEAALARRAAELIQSSYRDIVRGEHSQVDFAGVEAEEPEHDLKNVSIRTKRGLIRGRGANQQSYLRAISSNDINFGIGPAGTGKTYLAVACAVDALESNRVQRLLLVRPAVEAGEKLGFLPGDLTQKVDPYLRPLYDALYEMLGVEKVGRLIERNVIEVAPLAFMRGRTLNDAFVILDEAQNTTVEQMKMFLTRIGFGTTAVVTGDVTQIDLPKNMQSGLRHATRVLRDVPGISFTFFESADVVRHPLVQKIVRAYEAFEAQAAKPASA
jgi:phosphate starvation-inducible PhoH-like protein